MTERILSASAALAEALHEEMKLYSFWVKI